MYDDIRADYAFEMDHPFGIPNKNNPVWTTRDGTKIPVREMTTAHIENCMRVVGEDCEWYGVFMAEIERRKSRRVVDVDKLLQVPNVRKVTEYDEAGEDITYLAVPVEAIEKAATIEAEPVRHGEWIHMVFTDTGKSAGYKCSECGLGARKKFAYCHCGAKMDGGAEGWEGRK